MASLWEIGMCRLIAVALLNLLLASTPCFAQPIADPFAKESKWSTQESWNNDKLVFTFKPNGTFQSSKQAKGRGIWMRHGGAMAMIWTGLNSEIYLGAIDGSTISGSGFHKDGRPFGTFTLTL